MNLRSLRRIGREILVNLALPYLIYRLAQPRLGDVNALIASSTAAFVMAASLATAPIRSCLFMFVLSI